MTSTSPLFLAVGRQSGFWTNSTHFLRERVPALRCAMPGSTVGTYSATVPGCFWTYFTHFLLEGGDSDPDVNFVVLSGVWWYGEGCTVDASVALPRWLYIREPFAPGSHLSAVRTFPQKSFWERSMTHSCELVEGSGGGGVAGSLDSQVTCHPNWVHAPRCHMDKKHMSSAPSPHHTTTTTTTHTRTGCVALSFLV